MVCDWNSGVLYSGCVAPDIREGKFQYFDKISAIDLSCNEFISRISITECDDVCGSLQRILRSSHDVQVFCGDVKCVCILYICVYCSSYDIFYIFSLCNSYFFRSVPLTLPQAENLPTFHRSLPPHLPHLRQ